MSEFGCGLASKLKKAWRAFKSFLYGATVYQLIKSLEDEARAAESLFMLATFGDAAGFPVSCYYRLRLLPYVMPKFRGWKLYLARERDVV